jgi:hypothetical protein
VFCRLKVTVERERERRFDPAVVLQSKVRPSDVHEQYPKYSSCKYIGLKCVCVLSVRAFVLYFVGAVHRFDCRLVTVT